jgi:hypothetical protein
MHRRLLPLLIAVGALAFAAPLVVFAKAEAAVTKVAILHADARTSSASLGQVCIGDRLAVLDGKAVGRVVWYHVHVTALTTGACRVRKHVAVDAEGWLTSTQLGKPSEAVTIVQPPTPTPKPKPTPKPAPPAGGGGTGGGSASFDHNGDGKDTCADFKTQAEAKEALAAGYTKLDNDHDGIPCESLPVG